MANPILDSHYPTTSNAILTSQGWPDGSSTNSVLASHDADYPDPGGGGFTAVLNAGTGELVITGTGFGTKSPAAPLWFSDFSGATVDSPDAITSGGFDEHDHSITADFPALVYKNGEGVGGGRSLRVTKTTNYNNFHHTEKHFTQTQELFMSSWNRFTYVSGSGTLQVKGHRAGPRDDPSDPTTNYYDNGRSAGRFATSYWLDGSGDLYRLNVDVLPGEPGWTNDFEIPTVPNRAAGNHINFESYYRYNTISPGVLADGVTTHTINGLTVLNRTTRTGRVDAVTPPEGIEYWQVSPGLDEYAVVVVQDLSRPYIDNTRKRVFLGNAATLGACTGRFILPPTDWSDTQIVCSHATNIPSGYDWVYVMDENDAEIASGART